VVKDLGGKISDLVDFSERVQAGSKAKGKLRLLCKMLNDLTPDALIRLMLERRTILFKRLDHLPSRAKLIHYFIKSERLTPQDFITTLGFSEEVLRELINADIVIVEPTEDSFVVVAASFLLLELLKNNLISPTEGVAEAWFIYAEYGKAVVGFKRVYSALSRQERAIATLLIHPSALVSNPYCGKRRCSRALVVNIADIADPQNTINKAESIHDQTFTYEKHKEVTPDKFDKNIYEPCSNGIHYFEQLQEALSYNF
jgi:hypothetical protein